RDESADHWAARDDAPLRPVACFSPSAFADGVGRGETAGVGGAGGCVTKVMVCGVARGWPAEVFGPGPMLPGYGGWGARWPLAAGTGGCRLFCPKETFRLARVPA